MQFPRTARGHAANPLNWSPANRAWLVFILSALLHTEYLIWTLVVLEVPAAHPFMDIEYTRRILPVTTGVTMLSWTLVLVLAWGRTLRPTSVIHEYFCNLYYGITLCVFSYFIGTLTMATGVVIAGAPVMGFILFRVAPVLCAMAVALVILTTLSVGAVLGWWDYAPAIGSPVGADGRLSGFWLASMAMFVGPHLLVITVMSWYGLSGWRRREQIVRELSLTDPLTRMANRRSIIARLEHEQESSAHTRHPLSIIMVDLDHFKQINDQHGHAAGDQALQAAGKRLRSALRQSDHLGRFGGEEFLLVLPGTDPEGAQLLGERCCQALRAEPVEVESGKPLQVTASMGVYCNADDWDATPDEMLARADDALYRAKEAGRDRIVLYEPGKETNVARGK